MSTEKIEPTLTTDSTEEERGAAHAATRRKLLKAGIASAPVLITLQSGTAWAVSSCVDRVAAPTDNDHATTVIDSGRTAIMDHIPGVDNEYIDLVNATSISGTWPPAGEKDVFYLAAAGGSCYDSFCSDPTYSGTPGCTSFD